MLKTTSKAQFHSEAPKPRIIGGKNQFRNKNFNGLTELSVDGFYVIHMAFKQIAHHCFNSTF